MKFRLLIVLLLVVSLISCRSKKKILYFQNVSDVNENYYDYELKIQTDDLLYIEVMAEDSDNIRIFNKFGNTYDEKSTGTGSGANSLSRQNLTLIGYLVDSEGFIDFPVIGRLKVINLTKTSLVKLLKEKISVYVENPIIKIRFLNFKVTVLGEAGQSAKNVYYDTEKFSLPQLLAEVNDMTNGSERYKIVVVREIDGVKTINRVDMTQANVVNSPFYYLAQNDVVYIEPTRNSMNSGAVPAILRNTSIILGLIVSIVLISNNIK